MGHASTDNIKKLINNAGLLDTDLSKIISSVVESCDTCIKFKKVPPKTAVGLSKSNDFNETIYIDLHKIKPGLCYLQMINEFTRYSNAVILKSKSLVMKGFIWGWISIFGATKQIFSDNGGEFVSNNFYEMWEKFSIKVTATTFCSS